MRALALPTPRALARAPAPVARPARRAAVRPTRQTARLPAPCAAPSEAAPYGAPPVTDPEAYLVLVRAVWEGRWRREGGGGGVPAAPAARVGRAARGGRGPAGAARPRGRSLDGRQPSTAAGAARRGGGAPRRRRHPPPHPQGLAHAFRQTESGSLTPVTIVEPVSANALECMAAGGATSFSEVASLRARAALDRTFAAALPPAWAAAAICDDWDFRVGACARTWARPHAVDALMDLVPLGTVKGGWAFQADGGTHKRVLGAVVEVSDDDNVKQVWGWGAGVCVAGVLSGGRGGPPMLTPPPPPPPTLPGHLHRRLRPGRQIGRGRRRPGRGQDRGRGRRRGPRRRPRARRQGGGGHGGGRRPGLATGAVEKGGACFWEGGGGVKRGRREKGEAERRRETQPRP